MTARPQPPEYWRDRKRRMHGPLSWQPGSVFPLKCGLHAWSGSGRFWGEHGHADPYDLIDQAKPWKLRRGYMRIKTAIMRGVLAVQQWRDENPAADRSGRG